VDIVKTVDDPISVVGSVKRPIRHRQLLFGFSAGRRGAQVCKSASRFLALPVVIPRSPHKTVCTRPYSEADASPHYTALHRNLVADFSYSARSYSDCRSRHHVSSVGPALESHHPAYRREHRARKRVGAGEPIWLHPTICQSVLFIDYPVPQRLHRTLLSYAH